MEMTLVLAEIDGISAETAVGLLKPFVDAFKRDMARIVTESFDDPAFREEQFARCRNERDYVMGALRDWVVNGLGV